MFPGSPAPSQLSDPAANDLTAALADILPANALGEGLPVVSTAKLWSPLVAN
jgi:hypothetical protein